MDDRCIVCSGVPRDDDPCVPVAYYPGTWCHLSCLNSPAGVAWRERRAADDQGFARWTRLSTIGLPVTCPVCSRTSAVSAEARGMGAGNWEACCRSCCRITTLNGYTHERAYEALRRAEERFLLVGSDGAWREEVARVADEADRYLARERCACGDRFSLAAKPRCPHCRAVLLDSYFHYAYEPA